MFKKSLSLLLALLMILAVFVGCGRKTADIDDATADTTIIVDTTAESTEESKDFSFGVNEEVSVNDTSIYDDMSVSDLLDPNNFQGSDIPEDRDYGGYEFKLLADKCNVDYEFLDQSDGDLIKDTVIERQQWIEEYIGIDFIITRFPGAYENMFGYAAEIEAASGAGTPYDLGLAYNLTPPVVAAQGLSRDLAESTNLNLYNTQKEYWGKEIKKEIMVGGRIFWMSDNSSWCNIRNMLCIFANFDYIMKIHPTISKKDIYDMVYNGVWTFENMLMLIQNSYEDIDNIGTVDDNDMFGLQACEQGVWLDTWIYAAGFRYTKLNAKNLYEWTLGDQPVIDFIDWWQETLMQDDDIDIQDNIAAYKMFCDGRAMFALSAIKLFEESEYEINCDFTVLPLPLYKSSVKNNYSTPFSNTYSSWLIPRATRHEAFERSATVLELLAAEGNRRLAPVYFEIYLKRQTAAHDDDMKKMFNVIRNCIVFDMGYLYGAILRYNGGEVFLHLRRIWNGGGGMYTNITTAWAAMGSTVTTHLNKLMVDILEY